MKKALSLVLTMCIVLSLFATFVVSASAEDAVNLAAGKTYTYTPTDSHYYHSNEDWACSKTATTALTDGVVGGEYYGAASMVGWKNCDPTVTIDLGKVSTVSELKYNVFAGMDGIAEPTSVKVEVSVDGNTWTEVTCTSAAGTHVSSSLSWVTGYAVDITLTPEAAVDAQYVKLSFTRTGTFVFLSEIEVWGTEKKVEVEWKPFWLTHFNNNTIEGSGVIFTEAYTGAGWWLHVAFAPVAGEEGAYEIVAISDGTPDGNGVAQAIPEGGFVYALNYGNDYGDIDYTSPNCSNMITDAKTWAVGDKLMFKNIDLEGKTVPTSTEGTNWYDDAYVCTAQYAAYVPGYSEGGEVVITKGDNIALNKTYELNGLHDSVRSYDDEGNQLTDGTLAVEAIYSDPAYVGLSANSSYYTENNNVNVVLDLGESKDIHSVLISVSHENGNGIKAPAKITVSVSDDKTTWSEPFELAYTEELVTGLLAKATADVGASGRYVKYTLEPSEGGSWMFIDEVEVYEAVKSVSGGDEPEVIVETITVDGDLTDTGWLEDGWTVVNKDNGTFQNGIDSMKNEVSKSFSYKFQMRTDDTKLYVAAVYDCGIVEIDGNGLGTKFRLWINTNEEATVYTHFYDIYTKGGVIVAEGKYNTSTTENKGAMIGATESSTAYSGTLVGTMKEVDGKTYFEMSVDLAEFGGEEGFNYFFNAGFMTVDGENTDNIQMLYPAVTVPTEEKLANFPYRKWAADNDATADVEALKLGERVVDGETGDDLGDAGIYAIAALALVALIGTAVVIKKRA